MVVGGSGYLLEQSDEMVYVYPINNYLAAYLNKH